MRKKDIQIFSLDTVTQEEKEFLEYMYGDYLKKMIIENSKDIFWWLKAFQTVKAGKRPKFNWTAFFLNNLWALSKKNFLLQIYISSIILFFHFLLHFTSFLSVFKTSYFIPIFLVPFFSGFYGSYLLIKSYLHSEHNTLKKAELPITLIILYLFIILILGMVNKAVLFLDLEQYFLLTSAITMNSFNILYAFILMKFWLPVKKEKPS